MLIMSLQRLKVQFAMSRSALVLITLPSLSAKRQFLIKPFLLTLTFDLLDESSKIMPKLKKPLFLSIHPTTITINNGIVALRLNIRLSSNIFLSPNCILSITAVLIITLEKLADANFSNFFNY